MPVRNGYTWGYHSILWGGLLTYNWQRAIPAVTVITGPMFLAVNSFKWLS